MKIRKTFIVYLVLSLLVIGIFTACKNKNNFSNKKDDNDKLKIVCTIFPIYDWVKNIVQDRAQIELLLDSGTDIHNWQPSVQDIILITNKTDVFIHTGGESDFWVNKLLPKMKENSVFDFSIMKENQSSLEHSEQEHHHHHESDDEHNHHEHEFENHENNYGEQDNDEFEPNEFDEHIWLSIKRAPIFVQSITEMLCQLQPANADFFKINCQNYCKQLYDLDKEFSKTINSFENKIIVLADRNPFRYFEKDYNIELEAAFSGCSSDSQASFQVVKRLIDFTVENKVESIAITETGDSRLAKTIISDANITDGKIYVLNSLQGKIEIDNNYIKLMQENLEIIKEILAN